MGRHDRHLKLMRKALIANMGKYIEVIKRYFPEGSQVFQPAAGPAFWIELPKNTNAIQIYRKAIQEKVVIGPGPIFTLSGELPNYIRLNFGAHLSARISRAVREVGKLAEL